MASYLEKDWADKNVGAKFSFPPFPLSYLYSPYHEQLTDFIKAHVQRPKSVFEVGSSLGRTFYELCRKFKSLRQATLIEPSQNLHATFLKIFEGEEIRRVCAQVHYQAHHQTFQDFRPSQYDLVICSNVIDQCQDPVALVRYLRKATAAQGTLVLSCTYQWQEKYIGNAVEPIKDVQDLLTWPLLARTNLEFRVRINERYWKSFLSEVLIFKNQD